MDPIYEAYQITKCDHGLCKELEKIVGTFLSKQEVQELPGAGKEIGERIKKILDEVHGVAPVEDIKKFKEALTKGLDNGPNH